VEPENWTICLKNKRKMRILLFEKVVRFSGQELSRVYAGFWVKKGRKNDQSLQKIGRFSQRASGGFENRGFQRGAPAMTFRSGGVTTLSFIFSTFSCSCFFTCNDLPIGRGYDLEGLLLLPRHGRPCNDLPIGRGYDFHYFVFLLL